MKNTMFIKLLPDGHFAELTQEEFSALPGSSATTEIYADFSKVYSTNPARERNLDSQTPHVSARRFLQDLFPFLKYEDTVTLAVNLTRWQKTLIISQ